MSVIGPLSINVYIKIVRHMQPRMKHVKYLWMTPRVFVRNQSCEIPIHVNRCAYVEHGKNN